MRLDTGREGLTFACSRRPWAGVPRDGGGWKSQNKKNVYLSPYVEEPLNSKVIKSFVPELRSRYVFFEFRDSYVLSLWTFDVRFTHSHLMAMVQQLYRFKYFYQILIIIWPSLTFKLSTNKWLMLNWIAWNITVWHLTMY